MVSDIEYLDVVVSNICFVVCLTKMPQSHIVIIVPMPMSLPTYVTTTGLMIV